MRYLFLGYLVVAVAGLTTAMAGESDGPIANPPAAKIERAVGSPDMPGLYILHDHLPAGALVRPHQHADDH